jgi:hypothetical protein
MEWVTMGKPDINSVEVHAQLSHNRNHPRDGVLVVWVHSGPLSLWVLSLVVHGSHAYTLRIDWNLWCHVMKFEISLGSHHYAMIGIFDVMLWRYHLGRTIMPWLESLMSCYEVWDITWVALLHHDWNLWCHVMKFEISLGSHRYTMIGIFDVMLWSLRYHLGCTLSPHTGDHFVNLLVGLSRGELTLVLSSTFITNGDCHLCSFCKFGE